MYENALYLYNPDNPAFSSFFRLLEGTAKVEADYGEYDRLFYTARTLRELDAFLREVQDYIKGLFSKDPREVERSALLLESTAEYLLSSAIDYLEGTLNADLERVKGNRTDALAYLAKEVLEGWSLEERLEEYRLSYEA